MIIYIKKIKLKNYRCYKDSTFDFSGPDKNNLIVVTGHNGSGKSTLFNAIGWCIFNRETQIVLGSKNSSDEEKFIPNENSYDQEGISRVEVEVMLEFPEGSEFYQVSVTRRALFKKGNSAPISMSRPEIMAYDFFNNSIPVEDRNFINTILPESLAGFYLLDAEWLKSYGTQTSIKVSDGIQKLFRIDRFLDLAEALGKLLEIYNKKRFSIKSKSTKNRAVRDRLQNLHIKRDEIRRILKEKQEERNNLQKLSDEADEKAMQISQIADLFTRYKEQIVIRDSASKDIKKFENEYLSLKTSRSFLLNSKNLMEKTLQDLNKLNDNVTIKLPPDIEATFVRSLLQKKICICGRKLDEGSHEHDSLSKLLEESTESEKNMYLKELPYRIDNAKTLIDETEKRLKKYETDKTLKIDEYNSADEKKQQILKESPKELGNMEGVATEYANFTNKFHRYNDEIKKLDDSISKKNLELTDLSSNIEQDEAKLKDDEDLSLEEKSMLLRANFVNLLKDGCEQFADSAKVKFASLLEEGLNNLLKLSPGFEDFLVVIEPIKGGKFLRMHYKDANSDRYYLSGGQAEFVGIIIMVSFIKLLERFRKQSLTLPFVLMDNPLHDLDSINKKRVYENLSNFFEGTQVIVFMPDETFEGIRKYEHNGLSKVFILDHKKPERITFYKIKEGEDI